MSSWSGRRTLGVAMFSRAQSVIVMPLIHLVRIPCPRFCHARPLSTASLFFGICVGQGTTIEYMEHDIIVCSTAVEYEIGQRRL